MGTTRGRALVGLLVTALVLALPVIGSATDAPLTVASSQTEASGPTARISGRVVDDRGRPVRNFVIQVHEVVPVDQDGLSTYTHTRADGTYTAVVRPGVYRLELEHYEGDGEYPRPYVEGYWPNALEYPRGIDVVAPAGSHVRGVDPKLQRGGRIRGIALGPDGRPVDSNVGVYRWQGGQWQSFAAGSSPIDDGSGRFEISGLPAGTYRLRASAEAMCSTQTELRGPSIRLRAAQTVGGRVLNLVPGGEISGVVHALQPDNRVEVALWRPTGRGWERSETTGSDLEGRFRFERLCAGRYRLSFDDPLEYWSDAGDLAAADDIEVPPGGDVTVSATLDPGATITGRVLLPGGVPAGWLSVGAYRRGSDGSWEGVRGSGADDDGSFAITELPPGTYRLRFGTQVWDDADQPIAREYWEDSARIEGATDVEVSSRTAVVDIGDAHVSPGAELYGVVREALGDTFGLATVVLYRHDGGSWKLLDRQESILRNGEYGFLGLEPGRYRLGVVDTFRQEHAPEFWPGTHSWASAQDLVLEPNQIENVDLNMDLTVRNMAAPVLLGKPRVGRNLRLRAGPWSPYRLRLEYRWLANGKPIRGAHGTTYRPRARDVGKRLSVRVTGSFPHYVPLTVTTARTGRVSR